MISLSFDRSVEEAEVVITGSKSVSNRLLILKHFYQDLAFQNLSNSDDTVCLQKALTQFNTQSEITEIDVGHAGTAMRFLTALCAVSEDKTFVLKGSQRMHNRPISILVDALKKLGADISYLEKVGFPPLEIKGKKLTKNEVSISGAVSSQYISALLLIAPQLNRELHIRIKGDLTSKPYVDMTLQLLKQLGVQVESSVEEICVYPQAQIQPQEIKIESDWSSASYFFSSVAVSDGLKLTLSHFQIQSLQGDAALVRLYKKLGVASTQVGTTQLSIEKKKAISSKTFEANLIETPDLAQTLAVTCLALGIDCFLTGLHTLKIKETDRLEALKAELEKFGAQVNIDDTSLNMKSPEKLKKHVVVETYQDHRMAMAFAPLSFLVPLQIKDENVVTKSYPEFWDDMQNLGISAES